LSIHTECTVGSNALGADTLRSVGNFNEYRFTGGTFVGASLRSRVSHKKAPLATPSDNNIIAQTVDLFIAVSAMPVAIMHQSLHDMKAAGA